MRESDGDPTRRSAAIPDPPLGAGGAEARLVAWFSPGFPTGAFAYSSGLEWAVEAGDVTDRDSLAAWIEALLAHGSLRTDAVLVSLAHRAAGRRGVGALAALGTYAHALQPARERRLEAAMQGEAFLRAAATGWPDAVPAARLEALRARLGGAPIVLPVAVGLACAGARLPRGATLRAFLTAAVANLVSAALRLAPVGQSDGLRVQAALEGAVIRLARFAEVATPADLASCALRADLAAMRHETQSTRLFRS